MEEEGIKIHNYGEKISKKLKVFYNKEMKLNRDISLLVINNYFEKSISFCDPMAASGIRELRFLKTIPDKFKKIVIGDISLEAINDIKKNFKTNKIKLNNIELKQDNAINTLSKGYFDFIEIDPYGTPVPFLDIALQRIKHKGILSVTATDTAALCGTYPKTTLRRYGIKVEKTLWFEEQGLRNLIACCIREAAKYEKAITPVISFTNKHYYKIFFEIEESRTKALEQIKKLSYFTYDKKTQDIKLKKFETKNSQGKIYVGKLNNKKLLKKMINNLDLIQDKKEIEKLLIKLYNEIDLVGHYNPHKLEKTHKIHNSIKYEKLIEELKNRKFKVSRAHNNRFGIKTTAKGKDIVKIIKGNVQHSK